MDFHLTIDNERCKGCELCVAYCPCNALKMSSQLNSKGFQFAVCPNDEICVGCKQCADICPDAAIEISKDQQRTVARQSSDQSKHGGDSAK